MPNPVTLPEIIAKLKALCPKESHFILDKNSFEELYYPLKQLGKEFTVPNKEEIIDLLEVAICLREGFTVTQRP